MLIITILFGQTFEKNTYAYEETNQNSVNEVDTVNESKSTENEEDEVNEENKIDESNILQLTDIADENSESKKNIADVYENWKNLSDEELNEVIAYTDENMLSEFLKSLNEEELNMIISKDTMLKNNINIYSPENSDEEVSEQKIEKTQIYYKYLLELQPQIMTLANAEFSTKQGFFFIQISGDGKTTKRKITVTLSSTDRVNTQTVKFSEVAVSRIF